jgi:hypothetical protein
MLTTLFSEGMRRSLLLAVQCVTLSKRDDSRERNARHTVVIGDPEYIWMRMKSHYSALLLDSTASHSQNQSMTTLQSCSPIPGRSGVAPSWG